MRKALFYLFISLAISLGSLEAGARTFVVQPGSTAIQDAVSQAVDGDTVLVTPGRYVIFDSAILIQRPITLMSSGGPAVTVVDKQFDIGPVIVIRNVVGGPTIQGLTIAQGLNLVGAGGGIYSGSSSPIITENLFIANLAGFSDGSGGWGGAVAVYGGSPTIQRNTFVANEAAFGALYLEGASGTVDHNVFAYNRLSGSYGPDSSYGFGYSCKGSSANVHDNIFWANLPRDIDPACGELIGTAGNLVLDPHFCNPLQAWEAIQGDWNVMSNSPLAPGHPYYGWGAPLGTCAATATERATWGQLKVRYR